MNIRSTRTFSADPCSCPFAFAFAFAFVFHDSEAGAGVGSRADGGSWLRRPAMRLLVCRCARFFLFFCFPPLVSDETYFSVYIVQTKYLSLSRGASSFFQMSDSGGLKNVLLQYTRALVANDGVLHPKDHFGDPRYSRNYVLNASRRWQIVKISIFPYCIFPYLSDD